MNMTFLALMEKKMKKYIYYWWPIHILIDLVLMFIAIIAFVIAFIII